MRIGIVSQSYYPRYGGVTEHVHHSALELRRRGHEVTIITSRFRRGEAASAPGVERIGYNLLIPFNGAFVDLAVGIRLRSQLRALLRRHDFDIVHTHAPLVPTLPLIAVETAECPQVGTFHTTSGHSKQWRDPDRVNVLFVGRLDPRKGVQVLIDAMPEVIERTRGRARLLIVGDSYLRSRFEASVPTAARPHVHFLGHVPSHDLPRWYATGDVFVSPALGHESFGIVLAEAMAAGRAVVASDIPGYRTVVQPGVNGVVFPPGDVGALAGTIAALVDDPERRALLGQRGRARALDFAWPHVTDQIEAVYRRVLGRRSAVHSAA